MQSNLISTVILTHPSDSGEVLRDGLLKQGFKVIDDPMISTTPVALTQGDIERINQAEILIFTSKRGVTALIDQCGGELIEDKYIISIGTKTADALLKAGITTNWLPTRQTAQQMCEELLQNRLVHGKRVTAVLGKLAETTIEDALGKICEFTRVDVYRTEDVVAINAKTIEVLKLHTNTMICFTSPSAVKSFVACYKDYLKEDLQTASIGPVTTAEIKKNGFRVAIETNPSSYEELLKRICKNSKGQ